MAPPLAREKSTRGHSPRLCFLVVRSISLRQGVFVTMSLSRFTRRGRVFRSPIEPLERRTLFAAGDLDPSFGLGGYAPPIPTHDDSESVTAIDVANGRVVLGGIFDPDGENQGAPPRVSLAVLDSSGKL